MNMIEKVARAIDEKGLELAKIEGFDNTHLALGSPDGNFILELAKAAIAAMREGANDLPGPIDAVIFLDAALKE